MQPAPHSATSLILNVQSRLSKQGTVHVKLPDNILAVYSNNETNNLSLSEDGWYDTGVTGTETEKGIIINAERSGSSLTDTEDQNINTLRAILEKKCHYITVVSVITKADKEWTVVLFPRTGFFSHPDYEISPMDGCFCPRDMHELGKCLIGCLNTVSLELAQQGTKIRSFLIAEGISYP